MRNVTKSTRAGKAGKVILCPRCGNRVLIGHFAWSALVCPRCKVEVEKLDWLLEG